MSEQVKYYVCEEADYEICQVGLKVCFHAVVHSHYPHIDTSGLCVRKNKTTTCVEATEKQIIMARITGKI
jgi:hypothetical protein